MSETRTRPTMQLVSYQRIAKGKVWGVAEVLLPNGLRIADILILDGKNGLWAKLPSRRDERGHYTEIMAWKTRELQDAFSQRLLNLIEEAHPGEISDYGGSRLAV